VSHASEDYVLAAELHEWLLEDGHEVFLDQDFRDGIALGDEWEPGCMSGCVGPMPWCA
jgi:hypothetical protein